MENGKIVERKRNKWEFRTFKDEKPNEGMERQWERSCGNGWQRRRWGRRVGGGFSLWTHIIGSLISAQLCPSNITEQQSSCQLTVLLCGRQEEFWFSF